MRVTRSVDIEAAANDVWRVLGTEFYDVGAWTTSVPGSRKAPDGESRECTVAGAPGITHLTERLVSFDDATRSLFYEVSDGMPRFVSLARNSWRVQPLGRTRSRVTSVAQMNLRGPAVALTPLMHLWVQRLERTVMTELKHYVEHGEPTPAKRLQLRSAK